MDFRQCSIRKKTDEKKRLLFGTIDTFLIWRLTKGQVHATDATNASRTMIFNISTNLWDDTILKMLNIKNIFYLKLKIVQTITDIHIHLSQKNLYQLLVL